MKKALCLILAALMLFSVTGCNNNTASTTGKAALKLGLPNGNKLTPQEVIDSFMAQYGDKYDITIDDTPWGEFKTKLNLGIASGTATDVYFMDSGYVATAGHKGSAVDLKPLIDRDLKTDEYVNAITAGIDKDGHIWGVPHALNAACIFYAKDLFDKHGVEYPTADWTWDDMIEKAKKLSVDEDGDGMNESYGLQWSNNITLGWLPMMLSYGKEPISADYKTALFDDPEMANIWDQIVKFRDELKISPNSDWKSLYPQFYMGRTAMMINTISGMDAINQNAPDFNWDVQVVPKGPVADNNAVYVPNMWSIYSKATEGAQAAAWDWIKHYYSEESQTTCAKYLKGGLPVRKSAIQNITAAKPANIQGIVDGIEKRGHTLSEGPGWQEWSAVVTKAYSDYMKETPTKPRDQILKDVQADVQAILDEANAAQ